MLIIYLHTYHSLHPKKKNNCNDVVRLLDITYNFIWKIPQNYKFSLSLNATTFKSITYNLSLKIDPFPISPHQHFIFGKNLFIFWPQWILINNHFSWLMAVKLVNVMLVLFIIGLASNTLALLINKSASKSHPYTTIEKAIYK